MASKQITQIPELTSLRFIAAAAILLLHYRDLLGDLNPTVRALIVGGQYGVTFFFILSGFILTYTYENWFRSSVSTGSFFRFQWFRFSRIYPVFLLGLILDTPWHIIGKDLSGELPEYWASWVINALGLQAWTPGIPFTLLWNTPSWSISTEIFFYLCFPLICAFISRVLTSKVRVFAAWLLVLFLGAALNVLVVKLVYVDHPLSWDVSYSIQHYTPIARLPEFIAGCLTGQLFVLLRSGNTDEFILLRSQVARNLVLGICLIIVLWKVVFVAAYTGANQIWWLVDNGAKFAVFVVPFCGIILAIASGKTFLTTVLSLPILILLGEASYALYITHWTGLSIINNGFLGAYKTPAVSVLFIVASVLFSVFIYRFFEVPARRRLRKVV